ncbi:MAG: efflux transporter outer membrane subunit [Bacteroidota bacterium]|nr:efflux transporter outer membrane subunit [Candidatus Kapabacteria bacterium]MDW8219316.1 efflux transporter outer membrane subunit [Bacteroidota bacterium]
MLRYDTIPTAFQRNALQTLALEQATADSNTFAMLPWRQLFQDTLLTALIDTALQRNFDLQIALQRIERAQAATRFTQGELFPKPQLAAGASLRKFGLYTMDGAGNIVTEILPGKIVPIDLPDVNVSMQMSWEIDIWGKLRQKNQAAWAEYGASIEAARFVVTALVAQVATIYYELIELDNELDIIRRTLQKQREALRTIELQKEAGRVNELAVQQFEAQVLNLQAQEKEIRQQTVLRENALNMLLGRFPQPIQRRTTLLVQPIPSYSVIGTPIQMLSNRPDVREAEQLVRAAHFDLRAAQAAFFPTLTLSAGIGFQAFDPQLLWLFPASLAYNIIGGLAAPILNWQALQAQLQTAQASQMQALQHYRKTVVQAYAEVVNELTILQALDTMNTLKTQETAVLKESVDIAAELYKSAKATYLEVLIAQTQWLSAQLQLVSIQKRQCIAFVNLYRALGGGWR